MIKVTAHFLFFYVPLLQIEIVINRIFRILFYLAGFIFLLHSAYPHFHDEAGRLSPELNKQTKPSADWLAILLHTDLGQGHLEYAPQQVVQFQGNDLYPTDSYLPALADIPGSVQLELLAEAISPLSSLIRLIPPNVGARLPLSMRAPPIHV